MERVTIAQAAERLGVTRDAVRKRIKRHSIEWEVGSDGETYVYVDPSATVEDPSADASGQELGTLAEVLREQVEYLREQLDRAEERDRENRRIIAALTQRIPELEPPRESPETASEDFPGTHAPPGAERPFTEEERPSWWRRFFGIE